MKLDKKSALTFCVLGIVWFVFSYLVSKHLLTAIASAAFVVLIAVALYAWGRNSDR